ncbi:MAG TPA: two-component system sensor histidine kinase KdpD [Albitalea sp.]|uniref:two-component system sensor histidine kinase KdpD n=1 Tax=Piscinibacter sp. TaxID=1903157 RepID=UPI002ED10E17
MDDDRRPDPDALLARVQQDEAQARRGKLKIFFGASAGVGKTYAMLSAAQAAQAEGIDVVAGVVETHGRPETMALLDGLPRLPMKALAHRGKALQEFDLDTALARRPALVLVDELAHSNVAGSRHPKRWQDVHELLGAGIDVWTTMNVQHLDSLNDVVSGITGIRVWETVPDRVFDAADEVVIVDLPPDELLLRLQQGKVYLAQQAESAVRNFFRKGNLIALRELALRRTADRVDDQVMAWRRGGAVKPVWRTRESLLLAVGPDPNGEALVRSALRLATQLDVPWHAIYVETPQLQRLPEAARHQVLRVLKLAQDLGASTATLASGSVADGIVRYAREHNLSRLVLGRRARRRGWPWRRTLTETIVATAPDLDVVQIAMPIGVARTAVPAKAGEGATPWRDYAWAGAVCTVVTLLTAPLHEVLALINIVMLFLLAVVAVALRWGRGPAVLASFMSVAAFDFFYVPPRFSLAVSDVQYLLTFGVMLAVALVVGQLTAGLKYQARVATLREDRMRALYEMSRDLSGALLTGQIAEIAARFVASEFHARAALFVAAEDNRLLPPMLASDAGDVLPIDASVAQWSFDRSQPAGCGTDTLPGSPVLYLPLRAPMRLRGVLAIEPRRSERLLVPEQRRLLDTCASLIAIALERVHYVDVAQTTTVQMESERLRNSLLAAISHDLRTPLASLVAMADSMGLAMPPSASEQARIAQAMREAALRMNSLVNNLLDMARLQSGQVQLKRQWQPLEEVVGTALKAMEVALADHPVKVSLPDDLPLLHIDAMLIERVLCNLLENAVKYTPAGSAIDIHAKAGTDEVALMLDDHGPGLPKGREEAIFEKFERGRKESATPGVGLGLAICRAIAEAHGGSIAGETLAAGGARFVLRLPRGNPPALEDIDDALPADAVKELP